MVAAIPNGPASVTRNIFFLLDQSFVMPFGWPLCSISVDMLIHMLFPIENLDSFLVNFNKSLRCFLICAYGSSDWKQILH